jgi:general secretion pathway protein I
VESFDLVTHVVSLGPGSDRNGGAAAEASRGAPTTNATGTTNTGTGTAPGVDPNWRPNPGVQPPGFNRGGATQ